MTPTTNDSVRVVLLQDRAQPNPPGSCCRRESMRRAFRAAGASVALLPAPGRARTAAWPARTPATLRSADLVVAESFAAATAAARAGIPRRALWVTADPRERLVAGDPGEYAAALEMVAPLVTGFLVDGEPQRESVERALSTVRTRVELMPVAERCPTCQRPGVPASRTPPEEASGGDPVSGAASADAGHAAGAVRDRTAGWLLRTATRTLAEPLRPAGSRPRSVLVTGFDLRFAAGLADQLDRRGDFQVAVDEWPGLDRPTARTERLARRAQAIVAEWVRPNAVRMSRHKRPRQFLVTRLHRYELETRFPGQVVIDNVDAVVYIAPLFGRRIRDELGWPADKLVYIPNYVDLTWLDRPKLPGARFAIGLVGIDVARKRFDRALDILAALRREDPRFTLVVRSAMPWHNPYNWHKPAEREFAARCFDRLEHDPLLRGGVIFDPPGTDMARWYRRVGFILSCSDAEGSHVALAEGMASGAVPVLLPWPGADELYREEWICASADAAVAAIRESSAPDRWAERAERARSEVRRSHDPVSVTAAWADLLHGDLPAARAHFATFEPARPVAAPPPPARAEAVP